MPLQSPAMREMRIILQGIKLHRFLLTFSQFILSLLDSTDSLTKEKLLPFSQLLS